MRLSSARVIRPPRTPVRRDVLPLAAAGLAAVVAASVYWLGPPGVDTPAHLFQTWLYRHQGFVWWNNDWYSGRYVFVAYSVLFYPLAAKVGIGALAVFAAAVMSAATAWVMVARYGFKAALAPALLLAVVAPYNMMVSGAYPFLCGAAAMAVALACVQRGWRLGFAVAALVTLGFSPLALVLLAVVMAGVVFGGGLSSMLGRHRVELAAFVFVLALAATVQHLFSGDTSYPYGGVDLLVIGAFCVAGFLVAGTGREARSLRAMFVIYLAVNAAALHDQRPGGSQRRQAVCRGRHAAASAHAKRRRAPLAADPDGGRRRPGAPGGAVCARHEHRLEQPRLHQELLAAGARLSARAPIGAPVPGRGGCQLGPLGGAVRARGGLLPRARLVPPGRPAGQPARSIAPS